MFLINNSFTDIPSTTDDNPFTDYALPDWAFHSLESQGATLAPQVLPPVDVFVGGGEIDPLAEIIAFSDDATSGSLDQGGIDPLTGAIGSSGGGFEDGLSGLSPNPDPFEGVPMATTMAVGEETTDNLPWCWLPPLEPFPEPTEEPPTTQEPLTGGVDPWFPDWTDINSCGVVDGGLWVCELPWIDQSTLIEGEQPPIDGSDPLVTEPPVTDPFVTDVLTIVDPGKDFLVTIDLGAPLEECVVYFGRPAPDETAGFVTLEEPYIDSSSTDNDFIHPGIEAQNATEAESSTLTTYATYSYIDYNNFQFELIESLPIEVLIDTVFVELEPGLSQGSPSEPPFGDQSLNPQPLNIFESVSEETSSVDSSGSTVLPDPGVPVPLFIEPIVPSSDLPDPLSEEPGLSDPLVDTTSPVSIKEPVPISDDFVITTKAVGEEGDGGYWPPLETPIELDPESPFINVYPVDKVFDPAVEPCDQTIETYENPTFTKPRPTELDGLTTDPINAWVDALDGNEPQEGSTEYLYNETDLLLTKDYEPKPIYCFVECFLPPPPLELIMPDPVLLDSNEGFEPLPPDLDPIGLPGDEYTINPAPADDESESCIAMSEPDDIYLYDYLVDGSTSAEFDTDIALSETPLGRPRVILPWYRTSVIASPTEPSLIDPVVEFSALSDSVAHGADESSHDSMEQPIETLFGVSSLADLAGSMTGSGPEADLKESNAAPSAAEPPLLSSSSSPAVAETSSISSSSSPAVTTDSLDGLSDSGAAVSFEELSASSAGSSLTAAQPESPLSAVPLDTTPQDLPPTTLASVQTTAALTSESAAASASDAQSPSSDGATPVVSNSVLMLLLDSDRKTANPLEDFQLPLLSPSS